MTLESTAGEAKQAKPMNGPGPARHGANGGNAGTRQPNQHTACGVRVCTWLADRSLQMDSPACAQGLSIQAVNRALDSLLHGVTESLLRRERVLGFSHQFSPMARSATMHDRSRSIHYEPRARYPCCAPYSTRSTEYLVRTNSGKTPISIAP